MSVDRTTPDSAGPSATSPGKSAPAETEGAKKTPLAGLKKLPSAGSPAPGPPIEVTEAAARQIEAFRGEHDEFEGKT
ncbi:MAG: hypothetical protein OEP95_16250, partial [Myxococcales bacterium]|nr:hypothetical protein [Myxococcales bacterium]